MSKILWFTSAPATTHRGNNDAKLAGATSWWQPLALSEARGSGATTATAASIAGTTVGIEFTSGGLALEWLSEPLAADATIAGTMTLNLYGFESTMNDNTAINLVVDKIDGATGAITQIAKTARTTELGTTNGLNSFTVIPTSTVVKRGDRLRVRPFIDDIGTAMIVGTTTFSYNAAVSGAGSSYVEFLENLTFEPAGDPGTLSVLSQSVNTTAEKVGDLASDRARAQAFVAQGSILKEVVFDVGSTDPAATDNLIVEIQTDSGGVPSGTVVSTVATYVGLAASGIKTVAMTVALTQGNTYWLVVRRSGAADAALYYYVWVGTPGSSGWPGHYAYNGTTWGLAGGPFFSSFTFFDTAAVSTYYLTNTAETINPGAATEKKALTTRGSGSVTAVTNTAAGPTAGIQITASAGGTAIEWYTPALQAVTIGGKAKFNIRALESNAAANASLKAEIAVVNGDGSGAVVWGVADVEPGATAGEIGTTDAAYVAWVAGDDVAVTAGQRLRFRIYVEDIASGPLVTGNTVTVSYNGATAAAAGDTYVILPVAVTEATSGTAHTRTPADSVAVSDACAPVSFPNYAVTDNFNRTEDPLSDGGKWTLWSAGPNLLTNGTTALSQSGYGSAVRIDRNLADGDAFVRSPASGDNFLAVRIPVAEINGAGQFGYILNWHVNSTATVELYRYEGLGGNLIGSWAVPVIASGDQLGIRFRGTKLSVYVNGVLIGSVTDAVFTEGYVGLLTSATSGTGFESFGHGGIVNHKIAVTDSVALSDTATPVRVGGPVAHTRAPADSVALSDAIKPASFPIFAVFDNFNRTENPLSNGGKWVWWQGATSELKADGATALSQSGYGTSVLIDRVIFDGAAYVTTAASGDNFLGFRIPTDEPIGAGAPAFGYALNWHVNSAAPMTLDRYMGLGPVQLGSWDVGVVQPGDQLGVRFQGSRFEVYLNGVKVGQATDATYASGWIGLETSATSGVGLENFGRTGNAVFARIVSDSLTLTDSFAKVIGKARSVADSISVTDSFTRVVAKARTVADSLALTDAQARTKTLARTLADSLTVVEAIAKDRGKTVADALALVDATTRLRMRDYARSLSDSLALTDALSRTRATARTLADSLALNDALARTSAWARALADALVASDTAAVAQQNAISVVDTVALSDVASPVKVSGSVAHTRAPADTVQLTDAAAKARGETQADAVALSDARVVARALARTVSDSIGLSDSSQRVSDKQRTVSDATTATDSLAKARALTRTIGDSLLVSDALARSTTLTRTLADTLTLADAQARARAKTLADAIVVTDTFTRLKPSERTVTDAVVVVDTFVREFGNAMAIADTLALTDLISPVKTTGAISYTRTPADSLALTDQVARVSAKARVLADTLVPSDTLARTRTSSRTLADAVVVLDTFVRAFGNAMSVADTLAVSDLASPVKVTGAHARNPADTVLVSDAVTKLRALSRSISDVVALSDSLSRTRTASRTLTDALALSDALARTRTVSRTLADSLALSDATLREKARLIARALSDTVLLSDARAKDQSRSRVDAVALTDAFSRVAAQSKAVADAVALTDSLARTRALNRPQADLLAVQDTFSRIVQRARVLADLIALLDQAAPENVTGVWYEPLIEDLLALADSIVAARSKRIIVIGRYEPWQGIGVGMQGETANGDTRGSVGAPSGKNGHIGEGEGELEAATAGSASRVQ